MKRKSIYLLMLASLFTLTGCNNNPSNSTSGDNTSSTTSTSETPDPAGDYDSLKDCSSLADGTKVKVCVTITGTDFVGLYLQDKTGSFYAYFEDDQVNYTIGKKVIIEGSIASYANNKQIGKGFSISTVGDGSINTVSVNNIAEFKTNKYAPIKANVKLTGDPAYTANKDNSVNVEFDGTTMPLFIKKKNNKGSEIFAKLKTINKNESFIINGAFSNAYSGIPQISLTDPSQIVIESASTDEEKIAKAEEAISSVTSLNNTKINYSLYLPTFLSDGTVMEWKSSNTSLLSNDGKINRPSGTTNQKVTLTCNIKINNTTKKSVVTNLTIIAKDSADMPEAVEKYYSTIDFTKSGETLKTNLYNLINKHTIIAYSNLINVYADSDTYIENGKTYLVDIYSNNKYTISDTGSSASTEGEGWNKEHTVPQSWFGKESPMVSDAFHIYPTDIKVNSMRGNMPYGEVSSATFTSSNGSKVGYSSTLKDDVFEVADEYKGDIARVYFYMCTAYQDRCGSWGNEMFANTNYSKLSNYALKLMMKWAEEDPVSEREILRNNGVYKHQGNRNPFVDDAKLSEKVFGSLA